MVTSEKIPRGCVALSNAVRVVAIVALLCATIPVEHRTALVCNFQRSSRRYSPLEQQSVWVTDYNTKHSLTPLPNTVPCDTRTSTLLLHAMDPLGTLLMVAACVFLGGRLKRVQDLGGLSHDAGVLRV